MLSTPSDTKMSDVEYVEINGQFMILHQPSSDIVLPPTTSDAPVTSTVRPHHVTPAEPGTSSSDYVPTTLAAPAVSPAFTDLRKKIDDYDKKIEQLHLAIEDYKQDIAELAPLLEAEQQLQARLKHEYSELNQSSQILRYSWVLKSNYAARILSHERWKLRSKLAAVEGWGRDLKRGEGKMEGLVVDREKVMAEARGLREREKVLGGSDVMNVE